MKTKTLSEKREEIIEQLDKQESWNTCSRRYLVQQVLDRVDYQDKQFIKEILEEMKDNEFMVFRKAEDKEVKVIKYDRMLEIIKEKAGEKLI